jgi:hypothetical protein
MEEVPCSGIRIPEYDLGLDVRVLTAILVPPSPLVCVVYTAKVRYSYLEVLALQSVSRSRTRVLALQYPEWDRRYATGGNEPRSR